MPSIAVYGSFGYSFDSPAGNELDNYETSSNPGVLINPDLKPQKSTNIELGIKGNLINEQSIFFRNNLFELTLFNSLIEDEIVPFEVYGSVYFRNSAKTDRKGLELGITSEIYEKLKVVISYTFSDFKYQDYNALTLTINNDTLSQDFSGKIVPSVPKNNFLASLEYNYPISETMNIFAKGTYQNISGMFVDDANSDQTKGYQLLNSSFGLDLRLDRFNLLVAGGLNNILDERYAGFININSSTDRFYEVGEPQSFYASVKFSYQF
jgi:iron complex outermembrane receptor protein